MISVNLIWFGTDKPSWSLGSVWVVNPTSNDLYLFQQTVLPKHTPTAWLFWNSRLGLPDTTKILQILDSPGDVWHAGLMLGTQNFPQIIDYVSPTWTLNLDPSELATSTSWRISFDACLIRNEVIEQVGLLEEGFETLAAAALDMGYRYVTKGVIPRHVASLLPVPPALPKALPRLSTRDELRFLYHNFKSWQFFWGITRAVVTGYLPLLPVLTTIPKLAAKSRNHPQKSYVHVAVPVILPPEFKVTVIIPTINRYQYLRNVLQMLRQQTVKPFEVIVVDQTEASKREHALYQEFEDIAQVVFIDQPGQCYSRNLALRLSAGNYILLLDDDVEFDNDLIEQHLKTLVEYRAETSSGGIEEAGIEYPNDDFVRAGDLLSGGNTMLKREVFERCGLFDLAFDRDKREDGELGIRIYREGTLMVYNPRISVFHHRAPTGGLRTFNVRVVTYASSRANLWHRHIPSPSEIYLFRRYFTQRQLKEALWQRVLGTFALEGMLWRRFLKILIGLFLLPNTLWKIYKNYRRASVMMQRYPLIPTLRETAPLSYDRPIES